MNRVKIRLIVEDIYLKQCKRCLRLEERRCRGNEGNDFCVEGRVVFYRRICLGNDEIENKKCKAFEPRYDNE